MSFLFSTTSIDKERRQTARPSTRQRCRSSDRCGHRQARRQYSLGVNFRPKSRREHILIPEAQPILWTKCPRPFFGRLGCRTRPSSFLCRRSALGIRRARRRSSSPSLDELPVFVSDQEAQRLSPMNHNRCHEQGREGVGLEHDRPVPGICGSAQRLSLSSTISVRPPCRIVHTGRQHSPPACTPCGTSCRSWRRPCIPSSSCHHL